jgi:hypothetical protein
MSTYSAHHRVTGSGHPLDGGLEGYYQGLVSWVPRAADYGQKFSPYEKVDLEAALEY